MRVRFPAAVLLLISLTSLAACGGGGDKSSSRGYSGARGYEAARGYGSVVGTKAFRVKPGLLDPSVSSAGQLVSAQYKPSGKIVADSGFRPQANGFAFENYGNEQKPTNLTAKSMQDLFGSLACLKGTSGDSCVLTPAAAQWMENQNLQMAGGHCEGFSITALRMWAQHLKASDYGASTVPALDIRQNAPLQSQIAEDFIYQGLPYVLQHKLSGPPSGIVRFLSKVLPLHKELYTLGIYKADGSGGHAITPYAIENKGGGKYAILVYDNNFPGETRAVQVDTNDETWQYVGGSNPHDLNEVYQGKPGTPPLELDPTTPGERQQPCVFCSNAAAAAVKGGALPPSQRYSEITLTGDPTNHPHLVFQDDKGRITGFYHGKLRQQIPDVTVVKTYASNNWNSAPEPSYRFPQGKGYIINIDGEDLTKTSKPEINLIGNGIVLDVDEIKLAPGQVDRMQVPDGYGITYESNGKGNEAPNIYAGVESAGSSYIFAASAVGIDKGSAIKLEVVPSEKVVILDSSRAEGVNGQQAYYIVNLTKKTGNGP